MRVKTETGNLLVNGNVLSIEAPVVNSKIERSIVRGSDSVVYNSRVVDSFVDSSVVSDARVLRCNINGGVVVQKAEIVDSWFELNSFVSGRVIDSHGRGVVIYNAVVIGVELDFGTHISDGVWMRKPERFTHPDIPYDITEGVEDQILIGCWSRSVAQWLQTSRKAYERIGINRAQHEIYREAILELASLKALQPSPISLKKRNQ